MSQENQPNRSATIPASTEISLAILTESLKNAQEARKAREELREFQEEARKTITRLTESLQNAQEDARKTITSLADTLRTSSTNTMHMYEDVKSRLRQEWEYGARLQGSRSRALAWRAHTTSNQSYRYCAAPEHHDMIGGFKGAIEQCCNPAKPYKNEDDICEPLVSCLHPLFVKHFQTNYEIVDSHVNPFLNGLKPDISITTATKLSPFYLSSFIELKLPSSSSVDTDKNCGQVLDYILEMMNHQVRRQSFFGLLTDLKSAVFFTVERSDKSIMGLVGSLKITKYTCRDFCQGINCVIHFLSEKGDPHVPIFPEYGHPKEILNIPIASVVASFDNVHKNIVSDDVMVVKLCMQEESKKDILSEVAILKRIMHHQNRPCTLPTLLEEKSCLEFPMFAMVPYGKKFHPSTFLSLRSLRECMVDVLDGMHWLHRCLNLAHRDIRMANVVVVDDFAKYGRILGVLVDFDHAATIGETVPYEGGFLCCPYDLLKSLGDSTSTETSVLDMPYKIESKHDYQAYLLFVLTCIHPHLFDGFVSYHVQNPDSEEYKKLEQVWKFIKSSSTWSVGDLAAEMADYELIRKFVFEMIPAL